MGEGIKQGGELRRGAQEAILALFNLNTPQVTLRLSQLPKEYQVSVLSNKLFFKNSLHFLLKCPCRMIFLGF